MKYFEIEFTITAPDVVMNDARDILSALAGEAGFETFEEIPTGLKGYVQQQQFSETALKEQLALFPFEGASISYTVKEADDKDWNEQWEQEGFDPIIVDGAQPIIIHDGRHLPSLNAPLATDIADRPDNLSPILIEIDAHLAFGTGTHETTRMMVATLQDLKLDGLRVLDCGCGTGILGIAALKLGAQQCVGYDIDEWSADNARHNAVINQVDSQFESLLGDATVLEQVPGVFDIVMANINRNILLNDLPAFRKKMNANAHLLLSGFYHKDVPLLDEKASSLGLKLIDKRTDGEWTCLHLAL